MTKGTDYELLSKEIFETLVNQSGVKNITVQHNVILNGILTNHQIDVYWEFELGGIIYKTIVQTKNWNKHIDKGELLKFSKILSDIPGQPRGIFVTGFGYQKGAKEIAKANGIELLVLEEVKNLSLKLVQYGYARLNLKATPISIIASSQKSMAFVLEYSVYEPKINKYEVVSDIDWLSQALNLSLEEIRVEIAKIPFPKLKPAELKFYDESENEIISFEKIYKDFLEQLRKGKKEAGKLNHYFSAPTFLKVDNFQLKFIKILSITTNVTIEKSELKQINMRIPDIVQFVVRNIHKDTKYIIGKRKT